MFSPFHVFYLFIRLSLCWRQCLPEIGTLFWLVYIKKRSFLTSCVFWFVFLNASSQLWFRFFGWESVAAAWQCIPHEEAKDSCPGWKIMHSLEWPPCCLVSLWLCKFAWIFKYILGPRSCRMRKWLLFRMNLRRRKAYVVRVALIWPLLTGC